jgi:hypothetical protein
VEGTTKLNNSSIFGRDDLQTLMLKSNSSDWVSLVIDSRGNSTDFTFVQNTSQIAGGKGIKFISTILWQINPVHFS